MENAAHRLPVSDLDIFRSASQFVERHGDEALYEALMMVDQLLEAGDIERADVWLSKVVAIQTIQRGSGGALN